MVNTEGKSALKNCDLAEVGAGLKTVPARIDRRPVGKT
jgi:hypothetical protein